MIRDGAGMPCAALRPPRKTRTTGKTMTPEDPTGSESHPQRDPGSPRADVVTPVIRPGRTLRWSWVWLVPLLALAVGVSLLASVWVRSGPVITISFLSAAGVEAGQTKLRYR